MFIDHATIFVRSGRGGNGHVSFRREKFVPKGGPDGGDGGDGGSVLLVARAGVDTLLDFAGRHHWFAAHGDPGRTRQCHGANGEDLEVPIPPGTLVYNDETNELLADLDEPGKRLAVARGGRGGIGNEHFKSPTNRTPLQATPGEPALELTVRLELKLIADIGLVGLPNAGKSTLLAAVTRARPKIADYPFTTLEPNLGIAELSSAQADNVRGTEFGRRLVLADIPGLIEGAHRGLGLGTRFLRHIERTRLLVHLVELDPLTVSPGTAETSETSSGIDPVENYRIIRNELANFSPLLPEKPEIVAINKMDLLGNDADRAAAVELFREAIGGTVFAVSAATGLGLPELLDACWRQVKA